MANGGAAIPSTTHPPLGCRMMMGARAVSALAAADSLVLVLEATVCVRQCVLASLPAVRFLSVVFSPRSILCVSCRRRRRRPVSLCPSALSFVAAPPSGQECVVLAACSYRWEAGVPGPQVAIPARHPAASPVQRGASSGWVGVHSAALHRTTGTCFEWHTKTALPRTSHKILERSQSLRLTPIDHLYRPCVTTGGHAVIKHTHTHPCTRLHA